MKIAHIVCRYPPYYSGMGNVVFQTAAELVKLGHEVEVFTPQYYESKEIRPADSAPAEEHAPELEQQIDYARRVTPSLSYGNAARLPNLAEELNEFDLVHLHYPFYGTAGIVRKWKLKNLHKPLVITYHMDTRVDSWPDLFFKFYARFWMPKILQVGDALIASSFDYLSASKAGKLYRQHPEKWLELPFGVDINRFHPIQRSPELLFSLGLNPDLPTVLFVGGMDRAHFFKGVPVLLKALLMAQKSNRPIQAILVGNGVLKKQFEITAKSYGLKSLVKFVGHVDDEALPSYYQAADLLALPSTTIGEAFGMVLLEAFASGVPVIASDLPGVRTVAETAGMTFPTGDATALARSLLEYFSPEVDRKAWRQTARATAEELFAWPKIVAQLDELYRGLVEEESQK